LQRFIAVGSLACAASIQGKPRNSPRNFKESAIQRNDKSDGCTGGVLTAEPNSGTRLQTAATFLFFIRATFVPEMS
jgi:hypothetical protein